MFAASEPVPEAARERVLGPGLAAQRTVRDLPSAGRTCAAAVAYAHARQRLRRRRRRR